MLIAYRYANNVLKRLSGCCIIEVSLNKTMFRNNCLFIALFIITGITTFTFLAFSRSSKEPLTSPPVKPPLEEIRFSNFVKFIHRNASLEYTALDTGMQPLPEGILVTIKKHSGVLVCQNRYYIPTDASCFRAVIIPYSPFFAGTGSKMVSEEEAYIYLDSID